MTIDERLEALTHNLELHAGFQADAEKRQADAEKRQADAEKRHADAEKRHAERQADAEKRQDDADKRQADADKRQADADNRHAEAEKRHDEAIARIDRRLDRAIRLSVLDARRQRNRNLEFDEKMTQLAAAQLVTEEKLQGLIDALRRSGNGTH